MFDLTQFEKMLGEVEETQKSLKNVGSIVRAGIALGAYVPLYMKGHKNDETFKAVDTTTSPLQAIAAATKIAAQITGKDSDELAKAAMAALLTFTPAGKDYHGPITGKIGTNRVFDMEVTDREGRSRREGLFVVRYFIASFRKVFGEVDIPADMWVHIAYIRLPEEFGGDLSCKYDSDSGESLVPAVTVLKDEAAAKQLYEKLINGDETVEGVVAANGYSRGFNQGTTSAAKQFPTNIVDAIGTRTTAMFGNVEGFYNPSQQDYFKGAARDGKSPDGIAAELGIDPGDVAIMLGDKEYFTAKFEATGKGEQEALALVAETTGAPVAEIAKFMGIEEPPY